MGDKYCDDEDNIDADVDTVVEEDSVVGVLVVDVFVDDTDNKECGGTDEEDVDDNNEADERCDALSDNVDMVL